MATSMMNMSIRSVNDARNELERSLVENYRLIEMLSIGPFSVLWKVENNGNFYCLKFIQKRVFDEDDRHTYLKNMNKLTNQVMT